MKIVIVQARMRMRMRMVMVVMDLETRQILKMAETRQIYLRMIIIVQARMRMIILEKGMKVVMRMTRRI